MEVHVVRRLLELQSPVVDSEKKGNRKNIKRQMFKALLIEALTMAMECAKQNAEAHVHVQKLFYFYCKESGNTITSQAMEELYASLLYAQDILTKKKNLLELTTKILDYTISHKLDGGNTLIGLQPNETFFSQYYGKNSAGVYQIFNHSSPGITRDRRETRIIRSRRKSERALLYQAGDLAIFFQHGAMTPSNAYFVRITEDVAVGQSIARIYPGALEIVDKSVKTEHLLRLHPNIISLIQSGPTNELINDPFLAWQKQISNTILSKTMDFLSCQGILREDLQYIEALSQAPSLGMNQIVTVPVCKKAVDIFAQLTDNESMSTLSTAIQNICEHELQAFKSNNELMNASFQPSLKQQLHEISNFDYVSIIQTVIERYSSSCSSVLAKLEIEQQKFFNGEFKQELSTWWLEKIYTEYEKYVTDHGVDLDAIPPNYIDEAPEDIDKIKQNLEALKGILNGFQGIAVDTEFSRWLKQLMSTIYHRINDFKRVALFVLELQLDLEPEERTLVDIEQEIQNSQIELDEHVNNLIKDIMYVEQMMSMEEHIHTTEIKHKKITMSNVVPVSGLIMGSFYRLENELQTIIELYGNQSAVPEPIIPKATVEVVTVESLVEQIQQAAASHNWEIVISCAETARLLEEQD